MVPPNDWTNAMNHNSPRSCAAEACTYSPMHSHFSIFFTSRNSKKCSIRMMNRTKVVLGGRLMSDRWTEKKRLTPLLASLPPPFVLCVGTNGIEGRPRG
ncbi:hypothetical protein CDAR_39821 [Caerostris darwini]|uniref:Uncharacterized protein n=1 Tax=Caerostris darwini TaxID=1538125 RepID=A0AAV4SSN7_9ARAC|nr:hypothetical protein CDAR_39821 [Caerostris darwini]